MTTFIVFMLILSLLVLIHELGHFWVAKKNGVGVEEFGFGLPPKLFSRRYKDTEFSFNLLPFGGFVRLLGEESLEESTDPRHFMSKSPLQRASILVAGVVMNVLLAFFIYYIFFFVTSYKSLTIPLYFDYNFKYGEQSGINTVVTGLQEGSAAMESGIERGEAIIEVNGVPVYNVSDIKTAVNKSASSSVKVLLLDLTDVNRPVRTLTLSPEKNAEGEVLLGVLLSKAVTIDYSDNKLLSAPMHSYNMLAYTKFTLSNLIDMSIDTKSVSPVSSSVSGPVGIFSIVGMILDTPGKNVYLGLLDLTAMLSLSLAILNIMPFPALDGGRLFFVLLEVVRGGKRVSSSTEALVHKWGMIFLLALIVLVTFKDVRGLF